MDKQKVYKHSFGYYQSYSERLLEKGYKIVEDTDKYTVFVGSNLVDTIREQIQYQAMMKHY